MKLAVEDMAMLPIAPAPATTPATSVASAISPTTGINAKRIAISNAKPSNIDRRAISWFTGFVNVCVSCKFSEAI